MLEPKIIVDIKDLERLTKLYPEASRNARVGRLTESLLLIERNVKQKTPEGAGPIHLRDSYHTKVSYEGEQVRGIFGTPLEHGEPVEMGTRAHFPPIAPLQHWVERVLRIDGERSEGVAFAIARAISRRGTKGAHMIEEGFGGSEASIIGILNLIPDDIVKAVSA